MIEIVPELDDRGIIKSLEILDADIKNVRPKLLDAEKVILASTEQTFQQEGRPVKWLQLAESTLRRRRRGKKKGHGVKILQDTGTLKNSIRGTISGDTLTVAPSVDYGIHHQFGFEDRGGDDVVARIFMLFQDQDLKRIEDIFTPELPA